MDRQVGGKDWSPVQRRLSEVSGTAAVCTNSPACVNVTVKAAPAQVGIPSGFLGPREYRCGSTEEFHPWEGLTQSLPALILVANMVIPFPVAG